MFVSTCFIPVILNRVRFHYGHPDVFDRIFHITRGGVSKASKTINLSEDVFAGMNLLETTKNHIPNLNRVLRD